MSDTTYKLLSLFGSWLAGVGSLAAVITSLWLARRESRIKLGVTVKHMQLVTAGIGDAPDYLHINIVNKCIRPVKITGVGWEVGRLKNKDHFVQLFGDKNSDALPKMLNEGEEANLLVKFHEIGDDNDWIKTFPRKALLPKPKQKIKTLRAIVYTSVGQNFKVKVDQDLRKTLVKEAGETGPVLISD